MSREVHTCCILVSLLFRPTPVQLYCSGPKKESHKYGTSMNFQAILHDSFIIKLNKINI